MTRPRTVFGRRRVEVDGVTYLIELREDGIRTKRWRSHRWTVKNLEWLVRATVPQPELPSFEILVPVDCVEEFDQKFDSGTGRK